ncbi:MAG TPA: hypothetical protein VMV42_00370 [archaeon]|nr:hypothetical protein [archaeon]
MTEGKPNVANPGTVKQILISWDTITGAMNMSFPTDIPMPFTLGLIEFAKSTLLNQYQGMKDSPRVVVPNIMPRN